MVNKMNHLDASHEYLSFNNSSMNNQPPINFNQFSIGSTHNGLNPNMMSSFQSPNSNIMSTNQLPIGTKPPVDSNRQPPIRNMLPMAAHHLNYLAFNTLKQHKSDDYQQASLAAANQSLFEKSGVLNSVINSQSNYFQQQLNNSFANNSLHSLTQMTNLASQLNLLTPNQTANSSMIESLSNSPDSTPKVQSPSTSDDLNVESESANVQSVSLEPRIIVCTSPHILQTVLKSLLLQDVDFKIRTNLPNLKEANKPSYPPGLPKHVIEMLEDVKKHEQNKMKLRNGSNALKDLTNDMRPAARGLVTKSKLLKGDFGVIERVPGKPWCKSRFTPEGMTDEEFEKTLDPDDPFDSEVLMDIFVERMESTLRDHIMELPVDEREKVIHSMIADDKKTEEGRRNYELSKREKLSKAVSYKYNINVPKKDENANNDNSSNDNSENDGASGGSNNSKASSTSTLRPLKKLLGPKKLKPVPMTETICFFCKNNGEPEFLYKTHIVRDPVTNRTLCPVLRNYKCELCGASGDASHTRSYCPLSRMVRENCSYVDASKYVAMKVVPLKKNHVANDTIREVDNESQENEAASKTENGDNMRTVDGEIILDDEEFGACKLVPIKPKPAVQAN